MISNRKLVPKLRATITVLLADCAKLRTERDDARRAQVRAETRLRDAQNTIDMITARVAQADRDGLLTHRGEWPAAAVDAAVRSAYGYLAKDAFVAENQRAVVKRILDTAARVMHNDHVHVAVGTIQSGLIRTVPLPVARAAAVIGRGKTAADRLLAGEGHDAVGTTEDSDQETRS